MTLFPFQEGAGTDSVEILELSADIDSPARARPGFRREDYVTAYAYL
jgi:hypothetical protein